MTACLFMNNLWWGIYVYDWFVLYEEEASYWICKKKLHRISSIRVPNYIDFWIPIFWLIMFFIYDKSTSICQLKYKHRFMSAIYFDWIPICFIKCKNISFGKQNSCCSFNIASFNIAILIWCEERGKRFKSYANYLFYNFCDL